MNRAAELLVLGCLLIMVLVVFAVGVWEYIHDKRRAEEKEDRDER